MQPFNDPESLVRELIDLENACNRQKANRILADDFSAITRATVEEQLLTESCLTLY